MTAKEAEELASIYDLIIEELSPAQGTALWVMLGTQLAANNEPKFVESLSKIIFEDFEKPGPYAPLTQSLGKTVRDVAIKQILTTHVTQDIHSGKVKPNPLLMGQVVGEA